MQNLFHNLMITAVFYHVLVGCCWHHEHSGPSLECGEDLLVSACSGHAEHDHDHQSPSQSPPRQDTGCNHGKCCFVVPKTSAGVELADGAVGTDIVYGHAAPRIQPWAGRLSSEVAAQVGVSPHRLHLVNQVLLI